MPDGAYNPSDDGIAQGRRAIETAVQRRLQDIVDDKVTARMAFDRREQAVRFILDGLDGGDWLEVAGQIARKLTQEERVALLAAVIKSLPDDLTLQVLNAMFDPDIPANSNDHKQAAKFWADEATPAEAKAFVFAGIRVMPPETREAMRLWLNKGVSAP